MVKVTQNLQLVENLLVQYIAALNEARSKKSLLRAIYVTGLLYRYYAYDKDHPSKTYVHIASDHLIAG